MDEALGDAVRYRGGRKAVPEGADADVSRHDQMILGGADMIVATSLSAFGPAVNAVAARFPECLFRACNGLYARSSNVSTYTPASTRGRAVMGPISSGAHDGVEHHRLHRLLPDPDGDPRHQLGPSCPRPGRQTRDVEFRVIFVNTLGRPRRGSRCGRRR